MRKLFTIFTLTILTMSLVGCGSFSSDDWKEKTATKIGSTLAPVVASTFTCTNTDVISGDITKKVMELKWFKKEIQQEAGQIGTSLCELAVGAVLPSLIDIGIEKVPETWGCTGENVEFSIISLAKMGCTKLPF